MKSVKGVLLRLFIVPLLLLPSSCQRSEIPQRPAIGSTLKPRTETRTENDKQDALSTSTNQNDSQVLVNLGVSYNIITLVDGNLDSGQSDEQILIVLPLNNPEANLELVIASAMPARKQYGVVWKLPLQTRTLTGITLNLDDVTGDGRNELTVSGFDENNFHVVKILSVPQNGEITDIGTVFDAGINGNIDIIQNTNRGDPSIPASIVVQEIDVQNSLDLTETTWAWDSESYTFKSGTPRRVKFDAILEERMRNVYTGGIDEYKQYLSGPWYREDGAKTSLDYVFFDVKRDEILFHSGFIQEAYTWKLSQRTTAKRLYIQLKNEIMPSIAADFSISAESWDEIKVISNTGWAGDYHRLTSKLQKTLEVKEVQLPSILTGVWQGQNGAEIVFDLPEIQWSENNSVRTGIASFFSLNDQLVLQIQFIRENGAMEESINWLVEYEEEEDPPRKSISLIRAQLEVRGARASDLNPRKFEQILTPES